MATDFTQDSVLWFIRSRGGTVKNSELLAHFRPFLRDHDDRLRHREHFKKFVNSVATVRQEEGVSYVVLRKRFRGPDAGSPPGRDHPTRSPDGRKASDPGADRRSRSPAHPTPGRTLRPHASATPHPEEPTITPTPTGDPLHTTESNILPSAGILIDNNNYAGNNFNLVKKSLPSSTPDVPQRAACRPLLAHGREEPVPCRTRAGAPAGSTAHPPRSPATSSHQPVHPRVEHHLVSAGVQSVVETTPRHEVEEYHLQPKPSPILHQHEALHHNTGLNVRARGARYRKSYKSAVSQDDDDDDDDDDEEEEGEVEEVVPRTAESAGGEIVMSRPPQDNRRTIISSLPPSLSPPSLTPSLPTSLPPNLTSLPPSVPYSPPTSLPSACPFSLTPSLPTSQPPNIPSLTPSSSTPSLPSLSSSLPSIPSSSTPSFPVSLPPSLPYSPLTSLPSLSPGSRPPSLPASQPPNRPSSPNSPFPFSLHSSLPPSLPSSLPSSQPSLSPFLSTSPESQTSNKFSGSPGSVPTIHIQDLGEPCSGWGSGPGQPSASEGMPTRSPGPSGRGPGRALGTGLSSSHESLLLPSSSSCSDWLSPLSSSAPSGAEWNSSNEEMGCLKGDAGVRVANDNRLLSLMHRSEQKTTTPWHHSTGHLLEEGDAGSSLYHSTGNLLDNQEEAESSEGSASPPLLRKRPSAARRISSRLRSRKCMSLGEGLDLPFPGEEETPGGGIVSARHNRLHLLSSSLSLRYNLSSSSLSSSGSTPPRYPSVGELAEGKEQSRGGGAGRGTDGPHSYHRQVPLESREHAWLVKGAAGAWTDVYSLFRDEPSLLHRPDFISGFTILHWIAKHGDHRVLNTLWYGVNKAGLTLDVNVKAWNGCTPLHLATMHGHKKMVRVLVQKYHADVRPRDTAGKRAWQYLEAPPAPDLLYLLGAPQRTGGRATLQHHASCSTADRPQRRPLTTKVKRSTSIAAFLKHKSLLRFKDLSDVSL